VLGFPSDTQVPVSWSGGVLLREPLVRDAFIAKLAEAEGFAAVEPRYDPAYGAALYAQRLAGSVAHADT
jgi:hypothetical protein